MTRAFVIKNVNVFTPFEVIKHGFIEIKDGKIVAIGEDMQGTNLSIVDGKGLNCIPGFVDVHIHGANGSDVMDGTEEALSVMADALPQEGTTSFLATTITQSNNSIEQALQECTKFKSGQNQAEMVGIHLEGPFIEKSKAGAQPKEYICNPDLEMFRKWQNITGEQIKVITMAPELDQGGEFTRELTSQGIIVSAGHTNLNYSGAIKAFENGVSQVTHLCNAMNGIHHRDIGLVGATFNNDTLMAELIADGVHVSKEMILLIYQNIGSERLILITDSMRAKYLSPGNYDLGGQNVHVTNGKAMLDDGSLAGSILKLIDGARFMLDNIPGVEMTDIIKMTSMNPAKQVGIFERKGSIEIGKDADLLLVDNELNIMNTWCKGELAYRG